MILEKIDNYLTERDQYIVKQNPNDKLWYVLGDIDAGSKTYWMPVSQGFKSKAQADAYAKKQPMADKAAKKELQGWDGR
jgi:hypothetical protein